VFFCTRAGLFVFVFLVYFLDFLDLSIPVQLIAWKDSSPKCVEHDEDLHFNRLYTLKIVLISLAFCFIFSD